MPLDERMWMPLNVSPFRSFGREAIEPVITANGTPFVKNSPVNGTWATVFRLTDCP
jgi:hypothetical protein